MNGATISLSSAVRLLLAAVLLFGGAWPITKAALSDATPLWFGTSRAVLAALVAAALLAALGRLHRPRDGDRRAVLVLGLFQLGGFFVLTHLAVALIIWAHIPAVIYGALVEFAGLTCPLTLLENDLRQRAGDAGYRDGFIAHYLVRVESRH